MNSLFKLAKEPEITLELDRGILSADPLTFAELKSWAKGAEEAIARELKKVQPLSWYREEGQAKYMPRDEDSAAWSIARIQLESTASALTSRLKDGRALLQLMQKKIFLITSMAGQGKTNFVCDLIANQFRQFEIPCIFIPARELNGHPPRQRLFGFISNNRYAPKFTNIHEYFQFFNDVATESKKPFLIVLDGINEVTALDEFNSELRDFCGAACQYENVKLVITCRNEFFDEKYASILNEPFGNDIHRVADLRSQMSARSKDRLLASYLRHFDVTGRLVGAAKKFLKNDLLLLRIFCERYEGQEVGYIADIYKGDLFEDFLLMKIASFPDGLRGKALPTLLKIAAAMLSADDYSKLSVRNFLDDEQEVVRRLVADDIVLRQEIAEKDLAGLGDLVISFTYDELRDFIIAYMVVNDKVADMERVLSSLPGRPIQEGVFKYAYLLARKGRKIEAIEVCERADAFIEHFALNVHLLPPAVQNADDVARVKAILGDAAAPHRVRRVTRYLANRSNPAELLNATILIEHLNGLDAEAHEGFFRVIFSSYSSYRDWRGNVDEFVRDFWSGSNENLSGYSPERLAFILHTTSLASWSDRERVSTLLKDAKNKPNCRQAIELVRAAAAQALHYLLSDIEEMRGEISECGMTT